MNIGKQQFLKQSTQPIQSKSTQKIKETKNKKHFKKISKTQQKIPNTNCTQQFKEKHEKFYALYICRSEKETYKIIRKKTRALSMIAI